MRAPARLARLTIEEQRTQLFRSAARAIRYAGLTWSEYWTLTTSDLRHYIEAHNHLVAEEERRR